MRDAQKEDSRTLSTIGTQSELTFTRTLVFEKSVGVTSSIGTSSKSFGVLSRQTHSSAKL